MATSIPMTQADPGTREDVGRDIESQGSHPMVRKSAFGLFIVVLLVIGTVARIAPLPDREGRMLRQFPTEDGYLMLTIARNLAVGNGMSTANGTLPTNGTQPAATFIYAAGYWLTDGDKVNGVLLALLFQLAVSGMTCYILYRFARYLLADNPHARVIAGLAAAVWFANAISVAHTMNCLETGPYALFVILSMWAFLDGHQKVPGRWPLLRLLELGALLGVTFWLRNDAALLIGALCLTHLYVGAAQTSNTAPRGRLKEVIIFGATSVVVALPWLIHNHTNFGSIMPISGKAESFYATIGQNMRQLPIALSEYIITFAAIPAHFETWLPVRIACAAVIITGAIGAVFMYRRANRLQRIAVLAIILFIMGICFFYGLYFGAGHFVSRYLFPLSPFLAIGWAHAFLVIWYWLQKRTSTIGILLADAAFVFPIFIVITIIALNARLYLNGRDHMHFQVVEWVVRHVPENAWVGAPQSGTLGYFHDRSINLDGKVNPEALQALLKNAVPQYVIDKNIDYLADWVGLAGWMDNDVIKQHFELVVMDVGKNLAVLRRIGLEDAPPASDGPLY